MELSEDVAEVGNAVDCELLAQEFKSAVMRPPCGRLFNPKFVGDGLDGPAKLIVSMDDQPQIIAGDRGYGLVKNRLPKRGALARNQQGFRRPVLTTSLELIPVPLHC